MTLDSVLFELGTLRGEVVRLVAMRASDKRLGLRLELDGAPGPRLVGDPLRLWQILVNLTDNAIKFTEHGDVVVQVEKGPVRSAAVRLSVGVRHSGISFPVAQRSRMFQHFRQAGSPTSRRHGGAGLGLAICNRLVGADRQSDRSGERGSTLPHFYDRARGSGGA